MSDWIEWKGGECPVSKDTMIDFKRRCDTEPDSAWKPEQFRAGDVRWTETGSPRDIIAYRILNPGPPPVD